MSTRPVSSGGNPALNDFVQLWEDALERYERETGKNLLLLEEPFAHEFPSSPDSAEAIMECFERQNKSFKAFRTSGKKVMNVLRPIVHVVLLIKNCAGSASDAVPGGDIIFGAIGVLLQATKGVSRLYDAIESLFKDVKTYLERVSTHLKPSTPPSHALMNILVDTLVHIFTAIALTTKYCDIVAVKNDSGFKPGALFRRTMDYFLVLADKTEVKDVLEKIRELAVKELQVVGADTNAIVREIQRQADIDRIRKWLDPPSPQPRNYESKRQAGSCKWFFDDTFEDWKAQKGGMYWVSGHAGAGKSIICSSVIDTLQKDAELLLAYFYFDEGDEKKKDHRGLVSSLVYQIGTSFERGLGHLNGQRLSPAHSPTYDELLSLLSQLMSLSGPTVIVIDALDECPERARAGLLHLLGHLRGLRSRDDIDLRVLVTSRPENDIRDYMSSLVTHSLDVNKAREHIEDIRNYISTHLFGRESKAYSDWPEDVKWTVYNTLLEKSNGMFLWVVLQLQDLRHCLPSDVERALEQLPSDLSGTYERILKAFPSQPVMVSRAHRIFACIAFAWRPLSPAEVAEILSMDLDSAPPRMVLTSENPETIVLRTCPRLLEIASNENGQTVQFIHRSVKEYLTSAKLRGTISPPAHPYGFDETSANLLLAKICLSALVVDGPPLNIRGYADWDWYHHISPHDGEALGELVDSFLHLGSPSLAHWESRTNNSINTAFHWAAYLGLYRSVERMLERSRNGSSTPSDSLVRTRDGHGGTALHYAAGWGHVDVCRLLLEHGALADDGDNNGDTPLHHAASDGYLDTVRLLLGHPVADGSDAAGLRCRARNKRGQTALHEAAYQGRAEVCRVLIEHGALVDDRDNDGKTPLRMAKEKRGWAVVNVLLELGATDVSVA